jgi:hypothetical protein
MQGDGTSGRPLVHEFGHWSLIGVAWRVRYVTASGLRCAICMSNSVSARGAQRSAVTVLMICTLTSHLCICPFVMCVSARHHRYAVRRSWWWQMRARCASTSPTSTPRTHPPSASLASSSSPLLCSCSMVVPCCRRQWRTRRCTLACAQSAQLPLALLVESRATCALYTFSGVWARCPFSRLVSTSQWALPTTNKRAIPHIFMCSFLCVFAVTYACLNAHA